jgi:sporulation protein YlmC with PRC-barrel domain
MTTSDDTSGDVISSDKLEGTAVYNEDGEKLGSIDDLMIDKHLGRVRFAILEFGGFLGMGTDRYPMPWDVLKYNTTIGGYMVPMERVRLDGAPKYNADQAPIFDPAYGASIDRFYGIVS